MLAGRGERDSQGSGSVWRFVTQTQDGTPFEIRCSGPDLPPAVPPRMTAPSEIPKDRQWRETYCLVIAPPIIAFDIRWKPEEPLRIMTFSRGDWEAQLMALTS